MKRIWFFKVRNPREKYMYAWENYNKVYGLFYTLYRLGLMEWKDLHRFNVYRLILLNQHVHHLYKPWWKRLWNYLTTW